MTNLNGLFCKIVLSDKTIWSYILKDMDKTLRVVCFGKETEQATEKIVSDNPEIYYERVKPADSF
jgi:hypothetical protein